MRKKFSWDQQTNIADIEEPSKLTNFVSHQLEMVFPCSWGKFGATVSVGHNFPSGLFLIESTLISVRNHC